MRTTINLDDTVLAVIRATAEREGKTLGDVVEDLVRRTLLADPKHASESGLPNLGPRIPGVIVTSEMVRELQEEYGG